MRQRNEAVPVYLVKLVEGLRARLSDPEFRRRHRRRPEDFTRTRALPFVLVMLLVLQKTVKSIQRHLNEFLDQVAEGTELRTSQKSATPRGVTRARAKLLPSAFVELNTQCVLPAAYAPERPGLKYWHGHRLLGFDSSKVCLPYSEEMAQEFRVVIPQTQLGPAGGPYCEGRLSVVYDLLNRLGLDGRLVSGSVGEVGLALEQLAAVQVNDVILTDCGFTGYFYLACLRYLRQAHFVARCSPGSFLAAQELFEQNQEGQSRAVCLKAPPDKRAQLKALGLPLEMGVRFITVRLPDGTLEVLVTSLLEEAFYPTGEFKPLYHRRWGQETYHFDLKSHLDLENWSGDRPEAVAQDFAAAVLLCNLESVLTQPAQAELDQKRQHQQHPQQVNRAVSYHTLKTHLLKLLAGNLPVQQVVRQMQQLFLGTPISVRPNRVAPRRKPSVHRSYRFQRCRAKTVF